MKWDVKHDRAKKVIDQFLDNAGYYPMDMFYPDETSEEEYQKAKEHLIRLLRSKRKAATA